MSNTNTNNPNTTQKTAIPVKIVNSPKLTEASPSHPANLFPKPVIAKYTPIVNEAYFNGASLVIKDNATGEIHNSPIVWNK